MNYLSEEQLKSLSKDSLRTLFISMQDVMHSMEQQLASANSMLAENNKQIKLLTEQIELLTQRLYGRKSERAELDGQLSIFDVFNEVEATADPTVSEPEITEITISSHTRKKTVGKRDVDLEGLPARIFEHRLTDEELAEKFPNGYKELPPEVYKRLHIIPETFMVDEHHVHVYASKGGDELIVKAQRPVDLFRNSIATPALVASIINGKYTNGLPLERQSKAYKCNGINLATNTMANWVIRSAEDYVSLLYDRLHKEIYKNHVIHADETPVRVMRIDGDKIKGGKKTYMWVYRNSPLGSTQPVVLYDWQPSRRADHPKEFLKDFSGIAVTDGYQVYHSLENQRMDLKIAGCWIHTRRPFAEFLKSLETPADGSIAQKAYQMITEMLHIDNGFDDLPVEDRLKQRKLVLSDKVDAYFKWAKEMYSKVGSKSVIGRALAYGINQEPFLRVFLTDGAVPMDNNYAEQAIRPFTIGRKNFVLIESSKGAKASAILYSIVETAKANHLNPYKYFELLLTEIPKHMDDKNTNFLDNLLPWSEQVQKDCRSLLKKS